MNDTLLEIEDNTQMKAGHENNKPMEVSVTTGGANSLFLINL